MGKPQVRSLKSEVTGGLLADLEALLDQAAELLDERLHALLRSSHWSDELQAWGERVEDWHRTLRLARLAIIRAQALTSDLPLPTSDLCVAVAP